MVSVIIPVYNAEKFLKKCLDSVLGQTYRNLEVILVEDGSEDGSLALCRAYEKKDSRIVLRTKKREGQGMARNLGLDLSTGQYIVFVDADDWLHPELVEKLLRNLEENQSTIALCNYYKTGLDVEGNLQVVEECIDRESVLQLHKEKEKLSLLSNYAWGKLYKKELFASNTLRFPGHYYEDIALLPLLYAKADRISFLREPLYYYRNRRGNTTNRTATLDDRLTCMKTLYENFRKQGLLEEYREALDDFYRKRARINLRMVRETLELKYRDFQTAQQTWLEETVPQALEAAAPPRIWTFGSYSLMTVTKQLMGYEDGRSVEAYYGRESLISTMSCGEALNRMRLSHPNPMKKKCLIQDVSKKFAHLNPGEFQKGDWIFLDFLEERFGIGCAEGEYFTLSDAWQEMEGKPPVSYREIGAFSQEWFSLWKAAAQRFLEHLLRLVEPEHIVLVRMCLCEQYEKEGVLRDFPNREALCESNRNLEKCYDYFSGLQEKMQVVSVKELPYYHTSSTFRHGCFPWHLGNEAYRLLAGEISTQYRKEKEKALED